MEKIYAFGSKVVVERQDDEKKEGFIIKADNPYKKGKVISVGKLVAADLFLDSDMRLEPGATIAYLAVRPKPLGLGFPDTFDVIEAEDVVGLIYQEAGNDE